jgi:hypothetical protein
MCKRLVEHVTFSVTQEEITKLLYVPVVGIQGRGEMHSITRALFIAHQQTSIIECRGRHYQWPKVGKTMLKGTYSV